MVVIKNGLPLARRQATKNWTANKHGGKVITQPDMSMSIQTIMENSKLGMQMRGFEPIYLGEKQPEFIDFENMSLMEKLDFAKAYELNVKGKIKDAEIELQKLESERKQKEMEEYNKRIISDYVNSQKTLPNT